MQYYNILLIDDKEADMHDFKLAARQSGFRIMSFSNFREGFEHLTQNLGKFDGVILDALCLMDPDQAEGTESQKALRAGINKLNELKFRDNIIIPFCVYTGHYDRIFDAIEDEISVFVKGKDREQMFDFLKEQISGKDEARIIHQHREVFEIFDKGYLSSRDKRELLNILNAAEEANPLEIKNTLRGLRPMMEAALKKINELDSRILPDHYKRGNSMSLGDSIWHLAGRPKYSKAAGRYEFSEVQHIPLHIFHLAICIKDVIAATSLHHSNQQMSRYDLQSLVYSLLAFLFWFKELVDRIYKGEIDLTRPPRREHRR